ncbi:hypothetical protein L2735_09915 [Shewanella olleyana]|uniref:hypothetical protein n=1 Tax=Shewanella olleyana TaxID=135626 RepID=UPI00200CFD82|nr:hypothetical protein [Shewanella olleyana]MCL1067122.1 hypothetical protein [Shewanella olleyana]
MDIISTVNNSINLVKRLREISKNISDAEFSNLLDDLSMELADVKLESASLKEELAALKDEVRVLKSTAPAPDEKPTGTKWGCYQFPDDSGLYCTGCWDSKRNKSMTNRVNSRFRSCPVCKSAIGS